MSKKRSTFNRPGSANRPVRINVTGPGQNPSARPATQASPATTARALPATPPAPPLLTIKAASQVLGNPARWIMLMELCSGQALPVQYLAGRSRTARSAASKHVAILFKAGVIAKSFGHLYRLAPAYLASLPTGFLNLGPCRIPIPAPAPAPAPAPGTV